MELAAALAAVHDSTSRYYKHPTFQIENRHSEENDCATFGEETTDKNMCC